MAGAGPEGQVPMGVRTLLQLSNEKIDKVMEETAQVIHTQAQVLHTIP